MSNNKNSKIANAILAADETFLITLSNKGIYNRALKDCESSAGGAVNIETDDNKNTLKAEFSDGTITIITETVQNYKCTCPSRTVCKHLVTAVLMARDKIKQSESVNGDVPETPETKIETSGGSDYPDINNEINGDIFNFISFISEITPSQLEKLTSKKTYSEALFNIRTGSKAEINISSVLSVTITNAYGSQTVRFLPATGNVKTAAELASWANTAVCACKAPNFCVHKTEAVLHFISYKKGEETFNKLFFPENTEGTDGENIEFGAYVIPYVKQFAVSVFSSGLVRNSDIVSQRFLQLATICHSRNLANMERACDRIAGQYELFEKKSAIFSAEKLMNDLCGLILQCDAILSATTERTESGMENKNILGVFREQYNQIPASEFHALGMYQWHSASGYTGVTAVFYSPELSDFATYTSAMPDETNPDALKMYNNMVELWGMNIKLSGLKNICFGLRNAKINSRNNLSSSKDTVCRIDGKTDIFGDKLSKIRYDNFASLVGDLWGKYNGSEENPSQSRNHTALILPKKYEKAEFNSITQVYSFAVCDKDGRKINVSVKYEPSSSLLIENLKKLSRDLMYDPILLRVYIENGKLNAYPIALYVKSDEDDITSNEFEVINLSLDDLDERDKRDKSKNKKDGKKSKSKFFDW